MASFLVSLGNVIVDRSPDELIGAVIVAFALSLAMAGLYRIGRRNIRENAMPMIVLVLVANLISMAVGAGYLAHIRKRSPAFLPAPAHGPALGIEAAWADAIFRSADLNRDGLLSSEEASLAADRFVRRADSSGTGSIDSRSLSAAIVGTGFHARSWSKSPSSYVGK